MAKIERLLEMLAANSGAIVSTGSLSEFEIAAAKASDRMYMDDNYLGYVWVGENAKWEHKNAILPFVSGSAFIILHQNRPLENILFKRLEEARNYIKMQYPKRKFKEQDENVFVCSNYGTTFRIVELHYH